MVLTVFISIFSNSWNIIYQILFCQNCPLFDNLLIYLVYFPFLTAFSFGQTFAIKLTDFDLFRSQNLAKSFSQTLLDFASFASFARIYQSITISLPVELDLWSVPEIRLHHLWQPWQRPLSLGNNLEKLFRSLQLLKSKQKCVFVFTKKNNINFK